MNTVGLIIIESVILIVLGFPITYLVWRFSNTKKSFADFLNKYSYTIAVISFIIIGITIAAIRTMTLEE
jgi:hypothetical protein